MPKRTYRQYCGLATALDTLGERWTLLIVRNLLHGPKRFKDLLDGLPGVGTGLLSERLKLLESEGVIERTNLRPPAGSSVYRLTADGERLREVVVALARWGLSRLPEAGEHTRVDPDWLMLGLEARFDPNSASGAQGVFEMRIDGSAFRIEVREDGIGIRAGEAEAPLATATGEATTLLMLNDGDLSLEQAISAGQLVVEGDGERAFALARALGLAGRDRPH